MLMIVIIMLLSGFYFVSFIRIIVRNNQAYFTQQSETALLNVTNWMNEIDRQMDSVVSESSAESFWNSESAWERSFHTEAMSNNLNSMVQNIVPVDAVVLSVPRYSIVLSAHALRENAFYNLLDQIMSGKRGYGRIEPLCTIAGTPQNSHYIISRTINVYNSSLLQQTRMGELYVSVSLEKLVERAGEDPFSYALLFGDTDGWELCSVSNAEQAAESARAFLSAERKEGRFFTSEKGKTYIYKLAPIGETRLYLLSALPRSELYSGSIPIILIGGFVILAALFFALLGLQYIHRSIAEPISEMEKSMQRIREGELTHRLEVSGDSELTHIAGSINRLLDEIQARSKQIMETKEKLLETELLNKESRLHALQFQINPHFLYNTLEVMRSISSMQKIPEVSELINAMVGIFRYSTRSSSIETVREELACCRWYAEIIAIRFQGKYSIDFETDETCLDLPMLKMTIQPIIENAVSHGLEARNGPGRIMVSCRKKADQIEIRVSDDGAGMEKEALEQLRAYLNSPENRSTEGKVGLKNVHQRLIHEYGAEYGIRILSEQNRYTTVIFHVPCVAAEGNEAEGKMHA